MRYNHQKPQRTIRDDSVSAIQGLTAQEAQRRRQQGQGNNVKIQTGRTYGEIFYQNIVNLINVILFTIGAVMVAIGRVSDAVTSVSLIFLNVAIGIYQEIRAKRQLDKIALLTRPKVTLRREGQNQALDPSEIVIGDTIVLEPGDQITVDGVIVGEGKLEVDESQLTGESDLIPKTTGETLLSGSFVVTGKAYYEVTKVGNESFANKLTANARKFRVQRTPLQRDVNFVMRFLLLLATFLGFLLIVSAIVNQLPLMRSVQMSAVVAGLVPNGLFFMVIVAYALGALRIVNQGALIQQANSVESISNVNVLCMDKTGTLTANKIHYHDLLPLGMDKDLVLRMLADFAQSASVTNKTGEAIQAALQGTQRRVVDEIPFSSARKWSALALDDPQMYGVYVLGALEMLQPYLTNSEFSNTIKQWSEQGLRVLIFAYNAETTKLHDSLGGEGLPKLTPLAIVSFSDELRPHLKETLQGFLNAGVELKVISGDNPDTVAALARQAGFHGNLQAVSGTELAKMGDVEFEEVANQATIFGRITPDQKERLVDALKRRNKYVAMIGDGVNDVLSLKKANLGIAMQSGSAATRGVADMVLLNDSFNALPPAFLEGQRIVNGMQDILRLFLARAVYVALLIFAVAMVGLGFPYLPKHMTLITFITIAIPTFMLAIWAKPGKLRQSSLSAALLHFVIPTAFSVLVFGLLIFIGTIYIIQNNLAASTISAAEIADFREFTGITYDLAQQFGQEDDGYRFERSLLGAQTALTTFTVFVGLMLVIFVEPPVHWLVAGDVYSGDWRPTLLAGFLLIVYVMIMAYDPIRRFFELAPLPPSGYAGILALTLVWAATLWAAWRFRWLERFLGIEPLRPEIDPSPAVAPKATIVTEQVKAMTLQ
jgi:cation-transporting ATPase E